MAIRPFSTGGVGGVGFALGPVNNIFGDTSGAHNISGVTIGTNRAAAEATRDAYDTANSGWIGGYTGRDVNIILYYTDTDPTIQYQRRIGTSWVDNGPAIPAIQGNPGAVRCLLNDPSVCHAELTIYFPFFYHLQFQYQ